MGLGRVVVSAVLALGVTGIALAQQAPSPAPSAREYNQQILVPGSWFHGVHGLAFNKDDQLFAGSVVGQTIDRTLSLAGRARGSPGFGARPAGG